MYQEILTLIQAPGNLSFEDVSKRLEEQINSEDKDAFLELLREIGTILVSSKICRLAV